MAKVIRSNGRDQAVPKSSRSGFEQNQELEPEWLMEARRLDPNFREMVDGGTLNEDGSTVDKSLNPKSVPKP